MRVRLLVILALVGAQSAAPRIGIAQAAVTWSERAPSIADRLRPPFDPSLFPGSSVRGLGLDRRAELEIAAVILTGAGHLAFRAVDGSAAFIPLASIGWGTYTYIRARKDSTFLRAVGFTSENLGLAFRDATWVAAGAAGLMAVVAADQGSLSFDTDLLPLFVLYPAWGLVQQYLVQGLVARNLSASRTWLSSPYFVVPVSAVLFGAVHLPDWRLTAATTALGFAYTPLYLKHRNLWPLGIYHGVLGALFYFWVLEENPWSDLTR